MFLKPKAIIDWLASRLFLPKGAVVADFGCGGGYFTTLLAEQVGPEGRVIAIDILEDAIKETRELATTLGFHNIDYFVSDARKTSLTSDSIDLVLISQLLFQNEKPELVLQEAYRLIKPTGHLVVIEPIKPLPFVYGSIMSREQLEDLIIKQLFKLVTVQELDDYCLFVAAKKSQN
jgi:ubiquinone/menaquinone biosynthesis C-methylase UbiE